MAKEDNDSKPGQVIEQKPQPKPEVKNQNPNGKVIEVKINHKSLQGIFNVDLTWSNKKTETIGLSRRNVQYHVERGAKLTGKVKLYVPGPSTL